MSEQPIQVEGSKPPVTERVKAVLGTLRRNPDLVVLPAFPGGGVIGGSVIGANASPDHPVKGAIIGGVVGLLGGGAAAGGYLNYKEDINVDAANEFSDPGPVAIGKAGSYKDLVTAWKTGKPVEPGARIYHKDNPGEEGQYYTTESKPTE